MNRVRSYSMLALAVTMVLSWMLLEKPHAQATQRQTVIGWAIGWQMPVSPPWSHITQTNLFALQTTNGSALDTHFLASVDVPGWVNTNHAHGVSAFITIGGSADQHWQDACTGSNKTPFISALVQYVVSNGFDGLDLDIEDNLWASQGPPSPDMTACIQAVASAIHQAGKLVTADVITNWEGPWFAPTVGVTDQYNLMTYGDTCTPTCATFQNDVAATVSQGLPASKFVLGIDVIDGYPVAGDCSKIAAYAANSGLEGAMVWDMSVDEQHSYGCLSQFGAPAPSPSPTSTGTIGPSPTLSPSPTSSPTPSPTPPPTFRCAVILNGQLTVGTCSGTFTPG